jgi:hypothetical protein
LFVLDQHRFGKGQGENVGFIRHRRSQQVLTSVAIVDTVNRTGFESGATLAGAGASGAASPRRAIRRSLEY